MKGKRDGRICKDGSRERSAHLQTGFGLTENCPQGTMRNRTGHDTETVTAFILKEDRVGDSLQLLPGPERKKQRRKYMIKVYDIGKAPSSDGG